MPLSASAGDTSARPHAALDTALEMGFQQCVEQFRKTLRLTPLGWIFVAWVAWNDAPLRLILQWIGLSALLWVLGLSILAYLGRKHITIARDGWLLYLAAVLDGVAWSSSLLLLANSGHLYLVLISVICGVIALEATTLISHIRAYRFRSMAIYIMVVINCIYHHDLVTIAPGQLLVGIGIYTLVMHLYATRTADRIIHSLQLQIENARLNEQLRESLRTAKRDATTDALTGLANRRVLDNTLETWQNRVVQNERNLSVLMIDLDYFKQVNDAHGHEVGDRVLRAFAEHVRHLLRVQDLFARHGGEEFVILLPDTTVEIARQIADRIRASLENTSLINSPPVSVTASIGIAQHRSGEPIEAMMARADAAAYAAKHRGRNMVQEAD